MSCFARVHIIDSDGREGLGQTGVFYLPREVAELVRAGMELGHADDQVFGRDNSKQANGAIGILTDDAVDREAYYVHAVIMALGAFQESGAELVVLPPRNPCLPYSTPDPSHTSQGGGKAPVIRQGSAASLALHAGVSTLVAISETQCARCGKIELQ